MDILVRDMVDAYHMYYDSIISAGLDRRAPIFDDFKTFAESLNPEDSLPDVALQVVTWMDKYKLIQLFDLLMIQDIVPHALNGGKLPRQIASCMETCYLASIFPRYMKYELSDLESRFYIRARNCSPITRFRLDDPEYPEHIQDLQIWAELNDRVKIEFRSMRFKYKDDKLDIPATKEFLESRTDEELFFIWRAATRLTLLLATDSVVYYKAYPLASWYMRYLMWILDTRRANRNKAFTR